MIDPLITEILSSFSPIRLEEMDKVRLMDRVDVKYVFPVNRVPDILNLMNGGYKTLEINDNRIFYYQTTYLDTSDYLFFNQHVTGKPEREKIRYRSYETTDTTYLEVKKKTKKNRTIKWRIKNYLSQNGSCDNNAVEFIRNYVALDSWSLKPVLNNKFKRVTLAGTKINERITIDYNLSYSGINGYHRSFPFLAILELKKKGISAPSPVADIMRNLSIRPTGFSKYCIGSAILNDPPRKNIIKPKLLLINRIENEFDKSIIV